MRPLIYQCLRRRGSGHTEPRRRYSPICSGRGSGDPGWTRTPTNGLGSRRSLRLSFWGASTCHSTGQGVLAATAGLWPGGIGFASALGTASQPEQLRGSSYRPYRPPMWIACGTEENALQRSWVPPSRGGPRSELNAVGTARTSVPRLSQYPHRLHLTFAVLNALATSAITLPLTRRPQCPRMATIR